jgi:hypothetical protein
MNCINPLVLPVIQKIYDEFNADFGTDIENPLASEHKPD